MLLPRSHTSFIFDSNIIKTMKQKKHFREVRGDSVVLELTDFIFPTMFPVDPMHVIHIGIVKDFVLMWLAS